MESPIIVMDCNATCHKVKHTLGDLTHETMNVGVMFGFFIQVLKLAKQFNSDRFCFTWDSQRSHRVKMFSGYKEKRRSDKAEKTPEEKEVDAAAYAQFDLLYESLLPAIGFKNNHKIEYFEGDDIIASFVINNPDHAMILVTGDEDMYQCLYDDVSILNGTGVYTKAKFMKEYGIEPQLWSEVKAIAGCKSDEVPGINGVGEVYAIKQILGTLPRNGKKWESINCPEGKAIIARNRPLVTLPFKGCPDIIWQKDERLSLRAFTDICAQYNFQHFLKKEELQKWKTCLNLR